MTDRTTTNHKETDETSVSEEETGKPKAGEREFPCAKETLREGDLLIRAISEAAQDAIIMMDTKGRISFWNRSAERLFGYTSDEVLGRNLHHMLAPVRYHGGYDAAIPEFQRSGRGNAVGTTLKLGALRKGWEEFPIELSLSSVKLHDGWHAVGIIRDISDREEAERALQESENRLSSIIRDFPIPTFVIGKDHRVLYWNKALERLSTVPAAEVVGTNEHWRAFYAQERPCLADLIVDEVIDKITPAYGGELIRSDLIDGAYEVTDYFPSLGENGRWLRLTVTALRDVQGYLIGAIETVEDVTDRKEAQEALRESEEKYRTLVESAGDIVFTTDRNGYFTFANPVTLRITGYEERELIGKHFAPMIREDMREETVQFFVHQFAAKIPTTYLEYPILSKDGREVWFGQNTQLILNDDRVTGFQAVARDITEMREAKEQIRQMAYHDALTGLPNRLLFSDRLAVGLAQAHRNQEYLAVLMLDLDHFKEVNDTLGHDIGDLVLKDAADRLRESLRKSDTVARFGGDEFVLILLDLKGEEDVIPVARKIVENFRKPFIIDTHRLTLTTSVGIALYPHAGTDETVLMKHADIAMYQAKQAGRDRYQIYNYKD